VTAVVVGVNGESERVELAGNVVVAARVFTDSVHQLNHSFGAGHRPFPKNDFDTVGIFETATQW
jgi:hypothetical protein